MNSYNVIASMPQSTVVAEFEPELGKEEEYQSEADLEQELIRTLESQGYERLFFSRESELIANLRRQLERLNDYTFTDTEWQRFYIERISSANEGILEKTRKLQEDPVQNMRRDDGSTKNITLLDKRNIHNNHLQVINQYEEKGGARQTRYDVTILVNGFPMVHVELKRRGGAIREAFNQIQRYQRDSFWAASGLFEYVQIFVISNGTSTKYYSNTTRSAHLKEQTESTRRRSKKTGNSFEFTSYWAAANNRVIDDLRGFAKTFFAKHTLLNVLTRFCIFTAQDVLMVMRPYQIAATEKILQKIALSSNYKKWGTVYAGGYIWHTTGSGKTVTSFKAAQIASKLPHVDKVLFVVDRKDLDYQTMQEYEKFQKGSVDHTPNTRQLKKYLEQSDTGIIVTTIQKLSMFISKNPKHPVYDEHVVIIFDECHRSQFGEMHDAIIRSFKKYHLFGFTGTPIFPENMPSGFKMRKTTEQAFGQKLHTYTIVDAINDGNVLPFRIDTISSVRMKEEVADEKVPAIDVERAMHAPERIENVVRYILEHFDQKTKRNQYYTLKGQRLAGFNSIFAVSSIPLLKKYYEEFRRQIAESGKRLNIATIFSYSANEDDPDEAADEDFQNERLDQSSRDFLEMAIQEYNETFGTTYDTSSDKFQGYYKDVSQRTKNREIDILLVVNMFLTGFDATTLNTLWVDKNLRWHGLIQAFSRTNRILNSVKTFGNIVCFRDLQQETDDAISLFGNKDAGGIVLLKSFEDYYEGFQDGKEQQIGYTELIRELTERFPLGEPIVGEQNEKDYIALYGSILKLKNILSSFDEFEGREILTPRDFQDFQSIYLDLYEKWRKTDQVDKEYINDDIVFEMELVRQVEINLDYILMLVARYAESGCEDETILVDIRKAVDSSIQLRSKKELIEGFVDKVSGAGVVEEQWRQHVREEKEKDLAKLIDEEKVKPVETRRFMENALRYGELRTTGTEVDQLMPPVSRFGGGAGGNRQQKKQGIIEKMSAFFEKYFGAA